MMKEAGTTKNLPPACQADPAVNLAAGLLCLLNTEAGSASRLQGVQPEGMGAAGGMSGLWQKPPSTPCPASGSRCTSGKPLLWCQGAEVWQMMAAEQHV